MALNVATLVARVIADTSGFNRGMGEAEGRMRATGAAMQATGRSLTTSLTLPLLVTAGAAVKLGIDFQKEMTYIQTQAGLSAKEVKSLSEQVLSLAPATMFGPNELAKGLFHAASVTHSASQAMAILKVAAQGAAVGGADLESTVSVLAGTLRVFKAPVSESAHYMGILNAIVGAGNMRMQDLNNAIATGLLPTARSLHLGLADVGSALAMMTDESTPAQVAANRMRTALLMMTGETAKSRKVLAELGMGSLQLGHDLHQPDGLVVALKDLRSHLQKIPDDVMKTRLVAEIFGGSRSAGTVLTWLNNLEMVHSKFNQINSTAAAFPQAVLATQATNAFKLHQAWAAIQTVLIQVGGILTPFVVQIAQAISRAAEAFGHLNPHLKTMIVYGAMIVAALGPVIWIIGTVISTVSTLGAVLAAVFSGPGLIIAGIIGIGVALYEIYQHSASVRAAVASLLDVLGGAAMGVFNAVKGVITSLGAAVHGVLPTWQQLGREVTAALNIVRSIVSTVTTFVIGLFNQMASGIKAHSTEIRAFVQTAWNAIQTIFQTVMPIITAVVKVAWDVIKVVITTAMKVIGNIILAVMDLISGNWSGAWNAIKAATGALLHGIVSLIGIILTAAIHLVFAIAEKIGKALWDGIKKVGTFLLGLPAVLMGALTHAITSVASWVVHEAAHIGSSLVSGIISGITGLGSSLYNHMKGMIGGALHSIKTGFGIWSPSTYTRDQIGKPLAEGIVQGFLLGLTQLPTKMNASLRTILENARNVVQANQQRVADAWTRLSDYSMRAFDARTTQHLTAMKTKFDALIKKNVTDPLNAAMKALDESHQGSLDAITAGQNAMTPAESQLQALQDQHSEQQRQDAITSARDALAQAQSGGDPAAIVQAQKDLANALYDETIAGLQKQAAAERTQANLDAKTATDEANETYKNQQVALQAKYDAIQASMQKTYDQQVLNYQAERDLQKQHLTDLLASLEKKLELHPELWQKDHAKIMKLFKDAFGPGYQTAGLNLGRAFASGLRESLGSVRAAAAELAAEVAKYLKLHSPAEKGPLSDLHTWWRPLAGTLVSGIDTAMIGRSASGIAGRVAGGGGGATVLNEYHLFENGATVIGSDLESAAIEIRDVIAANGRRSGSTGV